jgi:Secretion system C-terminal sorting domain/von Willebrand factor type A domain
LLFYNVKVTDSFLICRDGWTDGPIPYANWWDCASAFKSLFMKMIKTVLFTALFWAAALPALAQSLKGKVTAENGRAASSVTMKFSNSENSIKTDVDGRFVITAPKLPDTLTLSGTAFETYKVVITEKDLKDPNFEVVLLNKRVRRNTEPMTYADLNDPSKVIRRDMRDSDGKTVEYFASADSSYTSFGFTTSTREKKTVSGAVPGEPRLMRMAKPVTGAGATRTLNNRKLGLQDTTIFDKLGPYANVLTAGEVNDFNKWTMWEDFTKDEFAEHSKRWVLNPKQRFSVQLQNSDHSPAVGELVKLVDESGNLVWSAYTDNTGKAELWGDIKGSGERKNLRIEYGRGEVLKNPAAFENGINTVTVQKACGVSNKVDIAFVVDATGSMGDEIEFLKLELEDVIRKTFESYTDLDLRVGSVFYRDQTDEYLTRKVEMQSDLLKVLNFVKLQRAAAGGDYPEAVHSALSTALDSLQWRPEARTRLLFLLLDAPPHDEQKEEMLRLTQKAAAMGIRIVPLACSGTDKSTEYILRSMALATNGTYLFLTDNSGVGLPHIKPTTDTYNVELLNSLFQRVIKQMITVNACTEMAKEQPVFNKPENIEKVKIYPNPTQGNIVLESKKQLKEIYITDFSGKILQRINVQGKQTKIPVSLGSYANGTYLVKYVTLENVWGAEKVILMH